MRHPARHRVVRFPGRQHSGHSGSLLPRRCQLRSFQLVWTDHRTVGLRSIHRSLRTVGLLADALQDIGEIFAPQKYRFHGSLGGTTFRTPRDEGVAITRLALIGNADIGGRTVEVKSADGFLDEGTPVVVVRVEDAQITVKKK